MCKHELYNNILRKRNTTTSTHIPLLRLITVRFYSYSKSTSTAIQIHSYGYPNTILLQLLTVHVFYG